MSTLIHPSIPCTCTSIIKPNMDFLTKATICCTHFFPFLSNDSLILHVCYKEPQVHVKKDPFRAFIHSCVCVVYYVTKYHTKKVKIACIYKLTAWRKDNHYNNILLEDFYSSEHVRVLHIRYDDVFCPITSSTSTLMPSFFMLYFKYLLKEWKLLLQIVRPCKEKKRNKDTHTQILIIFFNEFRLLSIYNNIIYKIHTFA